MKLTRSKKNIDKMLCQKASVPVTDFGIIPKPILARNKRRESAELVWFGQFWPEILLCRLPQGSLS